MNVRVLATLGTILALLVPVQALASHGVPLVNMSQKDPANGNATVSAGGTATTCQLGACSA